MDQFKHAADRYVQLLPAMTAIREMPYWADLRRMTKHCVKIREEISRESVVCRQRQTITTKYTSLVNEYTEAVDSLEKYVMLAHLSIG
jgi:hypothetical protein